MATPLTVRRAGVRETLLAVQARLASWLGWDAGRVLLVAKRKKPPTLTGDQDIVLRYAGFKADSERHRDRHDCRVVNLLRITLRNRLEYDEADRDDRWLTDATAGTLAFVDDVIDALQTWFPTDAAGNHLTVEGLFVTEGLDPEREAAATGWGEETVVFGCKTELPLTQSAAF